MLQHVGLSLIIEKNIPRFDIEEHCDQWMKHGTCFNTKFFSQLNGKKIEYFFKIGCNDRYKLMCGINVYDREHTQGTYDAIIVSGRSFLISSS